MVHTSWALLALMVSGGQAQSSIRSAIEKGVQYLIGAQEPSGDWPQEHITGVFNNNCMISYSNYR